MTNVKIAAIAALCIGSLVSCVGPLQSNSAVEYTFYAQDFTTNSYYQVKAEMLVEGEKCVVWAEKSSKVTQAMAKGIANEYDKKIRPMMVDTFSLTDFSEIYEGTEYHFDDVLDYANWLVGRDDHKLTILLLDIKDGFTDPKNDSFVAGYFWSGNFFPQKGQNSIPNSNERDMIYIDTHPGLDSEEKETYATLAHELQHLINFVTSVLIDRRDPKDAPGLMDTWIDEGLSSQAEYLYLGEHPEIRYKWFNEDREGTIAQGNNFFVWDNYKNVPNAILDEYSTVYLFFQWLYLQADTTLKPNLLYDIATSPHCDYQAVTNTAKEIKDGWGNWEVLLRTWLAANYINHPSNEYGYKNDPVLKDIAVNSAQGDNDKKVSLYPGEGVYSEIKTSYNPPAGSGSNIRYAGLTSGSGTLSETAPYDDGQVLLTFNTNTNPDAAGESGYVTGNMFPKPAGSVGMARTAAGETGVFGPFVLDARDVWGRDRTRELSGIVRPLRGVR